MSFTKNIGFMEKENHKKIKNKIIKKISCDLRNKYSTLMNEGNLIIEDFIDLITKSVSNDYDFLNHNVKIYNSFFIKLEKQFLHRLCVLTKLNRKVIVRNNLKSRDLIEIKSIKYNNINSTDLNEYNNSMLSYDPEFYYTTKNKLFFKNQNRFINEGNKNRVFENKNKGNVHEDKCNKDIYSSTFYRYGMNNEGNSSSNIKNCLNENSINDKETVNKSYNIETEKNNSSNLLMRNLDDLRFRKTLALIIDRENRELFPVKSSKYYKNKDPYNNASNFNNTSIIYNKGYNSPLTTTYSFKENDKEVKKEKALSEVFFINQYFKELDKLNEKRLEDITLKLNKKRQEILNLFSKVEDELGFVYGSDKKQIILNELLREYKEKVLKQADNAYNSEIINSMVDYTNKERRAEEDCKKLIYKQLLDSQINEREEYVKNKKEIEIVKNPQLYNIQKPYYSKEDYFNLRNKSSIAFAN